ncbi:filamin-A-like [Elysia marginata]|uniref:Filamin-A-like n=1 Tax=Elysia marginata TaxID=1093978 RepID=A0AAV4GA43_9GAST|nr:filamin-A-like [Elysia marginata]
MTSRSVVIQQSEDKRFYAFTRDWQDGQALVNLVQSAGGTVTVQPGEQADNVQLIQAALDAGQQQLGIEPLLSAKEINAQHTHHLGMMTYSSQYFRYSNSMPYEGYHLTEPKTRISNNVSYNSINGGPKDNVSIIKTNYSNRNGVKHLHNGNHNNYNYSQKYDYNQHHNHIVNNNNNNSINSYPYTNGHLNSNSNNTSLYSEVFKPLRWATVLYKNLPNYTAELLVLRCDKEADMTKGGYYYANEVCVLADKISSPWIWFRPIKFNDVVPFVAQRYIKNASPHDN